uniref:MORC family CW-type zinc finger 3a n=1 Tax=Oryzias melastigma TaxID=30732 RepID=A0A3B3D9T4_ORYME
MSAQAAREVPLSTLSPKYLHSNSTSHTSPFSAIAELIDNAYDPDVSAKQFWIDKTFIKENLCLTFMDNGNGLDHKTMQKMLSFGYSDKTAVKGHEPIGMYGNGFKSGSMRLGKDAIVFSRSDSGMCIGMLSQTYLEEIGAEQIQIPIVCIEERNLSGFSVKAEHRASLQDILRYSLFQTQGELLAELDAITSSFSEEQTGTRIIIWNLRRTATDAAEFDFEKDRYDIRIPSEVYEAISDPSKMSERTASYIPETVYSLRAYCSILYLKPRMQVVLRGKKVKTVLIAKSLAYTRKDFYKPIFLSKRVPILFGFNTKTKDQYGVMMYHKNRLIKAYERVGCQLKANNMGVGVIGIIECNFLDPTHNKQSFIESDKYRKTMNNLGIKLEDYWKETQYRRKTEDPNSSIPVEDTIKRPDQNWVQCDGCLKWRKLPDGIDCSKLPTEWFCRMNPDPQFRSCKVEEEPEDSDDEQPSYRKTYKLHEREDKMKKEKIQQQIFRQQEQDRFAAITAQNNALKKQQESLRRQLHQMSPSIPTTPRNRSPLLRSSTISQAAVSPSESNGLPVITNVCSLSTNPSALKRPPPSPLTTPKRPRVSLPSRISSASAEIDARSPSVPAEVEDLDDSTDDDVSILESCSTPKPAKPVYDVGKVKKEVKTEESVNSISMLLDCTDDAAVDAPSEQNPAGTGCPTDTASATTQTEILKVKLEKESQSLTEGNKTVNPGAFSSTQSANAQSLKITEFKQEKNSQTEENLQNGETLMEKGGTSHESQSITEVQRQQDELLELLQDTAQERDNFREELQELTVQLQEMQKKLSETSQKAGSNQPCQAEKSEGRDYKALFERAKQKVHDLVKDKQALIAAAERKTNLSAEEKDIDEISLKVGCLVQELDKRNQEMDELRLQLNSLEEEKSSLAAECEELRCKLQQQADSTRGLHFSASHAEKPGGSAEADLNSTSEAMTSLIELRQNVGRLLVSYMPALELDQVNYECNVIDEILEQYLSSLDSN